VGGLPEVVDHGISGYLAPVGDVDAMAEYALRILSQCQEKRAFARSARERAVRCFHYQKIIPQYEAVYEKILNS
jgi:glycosyltransferase involved in cell wall biosynthesis